MPLARHFDFDSFSVENFYLYSTDKKGHDRELRVHIEPDAMRVIAIALTSDAFPFRTRNDFVRDAVIKSASHLYAASEDPQFKEQLGPLLRLMKMKDLFATLRARGELEEGLVRDMEDQILTDRHDPAKMLQHVNALHDARKDLTTTEATGYLDRLIEKYDI